MFFIIKWLTGIFICITNFFFFHWLLLSSFEPSIPLIFWFPNLFRHMVGLLGRVISSSQGLYPHKTTQHRKTWTNIHALSGIRTHDPSNQPAKIHASDCTATVTGLFLFCSLNIIIQAWSTKTVTWVAVKKVKNH
jgi:hypothetical protein